MSASLEACLQLLELLYEGLACPRLWNDFLAELCRRINCEMAALAFHDAENQNPSTDFSYGLSSQILEEWNSYYGKRNPRAQEILQGLRESGGWLSAASLSGAPTALLDSEYAQWMRSRQLCHSVIAAIPGGRGAAVSLSLVRPPATKPFSQEAVEFVRPILPHFRRAFGIYRKLETMRAFSEAGKLALDRLDTGVAAVDSEGRVVLMNERAEATLRKQGAVTLREGRLAAKDSEQSNRLDRLVRSAAKTGAGGGADSGGAILLEGDKTSEPLPITATPFRSAHPLTQRQACALVFISDPAAKPRSRSALLRSLFGLTPAECRLAQLLLEGRDLRAASSHLRVTAATARFMLKNVFHKTASHRQSQLIRLLSILPGEPQTDSAAPEPESNRNASCAKCTLSVPAAK